MNMRRMGLVAVMTTVITIIMSMELIATMIMYMTSIAVIIISNLPYDHLATPQKRG